MSNYPYHRPRSLEELWPLMASSEEARLVAGGTDLMVRIRARTERPGSLVSLRSIESLRGIEVGEESARIGAGVTVGELTCHPGLARLAPVLVQAARRLGSPQIRNAATIGGNLCNAAPSADTALPLLVLEARLLLRSPGGVREVPADQFFKGPGQTCLAPDEILEAVELDAPPAGAGAVFFKKGRVRMDLSLASVAVLLQMGEGGPEGEGKVIRTARVAAGSVAPVPLRLKEVEQRLEGQALTAELLAEARQLAQASIQPVTDVRTTAEYRRTLVGVYVQRALRSLSQPGGEA